MHSRVIRLDDWKKRKKTRNNDCLKEANDYILQELDTDLEEIVRISRMRGKYFDIRQPAKELPEDRILLEKIKRDLEAIGVYVEGPVT